MSNQDQKVPHSAFYHLGEEQKEVFMSFALLNRLTFIVGDIGNIPLIHVNPQMREAFLEEVLAERSKSGLVQKEVKLEELDISLEEMEAMLDWAAEHVMDFLLRTLEKAQKLQLKHEQRMTTLQSSQPGLGNKASKTSPASPSTEPQASSTE